MSRAGASGGPEPAGASHVLLYDGACEICRRSVEWFERSSPRVSVEALPYQDSEVPHRFPDIPDERMREAIQLVRSDGQRWEGARAAEELLKMVPRWRRLAPAFRVPGVRRIARGAYRLVARNRGRFGCGDHCGVAGEFPDSTGEAVSDEDSDSGPGR